MDLIKLRFHPLQDSLDKDRLYRKFECQFVNVVNRTGVDLTDCARFPHRSGVLQFVSGLGPRKASDLLKVISLFLLFSFK